MTDLKAQLNESLANADWKDLMPHAQRDAIIIVDETLDLLDVGVALAKDDTLAVKHWISEQLIHKPSSEELSLWNLTPEQQFKALIVQPFVLIQSSAPPDLTKIRATFSENLENSRKIVNS